MRSCGYDAEEEEDDDVCGLLCETTSAGRLEDRPTRFETR